MPHHGSTKKDEETAAASWEAAKGAAVGAAKWGLVFAAGGAVAYRFSPLYKSLTIQFKTYIQMSGMILGGMLDADKRTVAYQHAIRQQRRREHEMEMWRKYEEEFEEAGTPGVGSEGGVGGGGKRK